MRSDFTYEELLAMPEWQNKRIEIINKRDKLICQRCNNKSYEKEDFYGVFMIPSKTADPRMQFKSFSDKFEIIYSDDIEGIGLIKDTAMLYLVKHKYSGDGIQKQGYYPAAARELTTLELNHHFPLKNSSLSFDEKMKLVTQGDFSVLFNRVEKKELINVPFNQLKWIFVKDLHVHHTYYQIDKMPWEYPDDSFTTLCRSCHTEVHEKEKIPILDKKGFKIGNYKPCAKCNGAGWFPEYSHVQNGICFSCRGQKYLDRKFITSI